MPATKAQIRANNKYKKNHYDRLEMQVPKGEKESITEHAKEYDGTLNKFLNRAVKETMERDKNNWPVWRWLLCRLLKTWWMLNLINCGLVPIS